MSSLTSKVDLVGLPSNSFVELIQKLDFKMRELIKIKNWKNYTDYKQNFIEVIDEVETIIKEIEKLKGNNFAKKSFNEIKDDLGNLKKGLKFISLDCESCESKNKFNWECLFNDSNDLSEGQKIFRKRHMPIFESIQRIKCLKVGE